LPVFFTKRKLTTFVVEQNSPLQKQQKKSNGTCPVCQRKYFPFGKKNVQVQKKNSQNLQAHKNISPGKA